MSIIARCEGCQKSYKVADELAGKRKRCKACGHVVTVPALAAAPPPIPREEDDLIPLAPTGAASAARPAARLRVPPPLPRPGAPSVPPPLPGARQPMPAGVPVPVSAASYGSADAEESAYVTISHEGAIDRLLPFVFVGLFVLFLIVVTVRGASQVRAASGGFWVSREMRDEAVGRVIEFAFGYALAVAAVAGLCTLGVFIASRIMKFPNRPRLYWRCLAVVCAPTALAGTVSALMGVAPGEASVPVYFGLPTMLVALWLLLRLRAAQFMVTAVFVLLLAAGVPVAIILGATGIPRLGSTSNSATATPPAQSSAPVPLPPGSRERKYSIAKPGEAVVNAETEMRRPLTIQEKYQLERAEAQMRKLAAAIQDYAARNRGTFPDSLAHLVNAGLIPGEGVREDASSHYRYAGNGYMKYPAPAKMIMVERDDPRYPRHTVMFGDGRVESIEPVRWQKVREESDDAARAFAAQRSGGRR